MLHPVMHLTFPLIDFAAHTFHPVVRLPEDYEVLDFTRGAKAERFRNSPFTIGRYDEDRAIYTSELFTGGRSVHVGLDIGAPAGTEVLCPYKGALFLQGRNEAEGDYGPTVVTQHQLGDVDLWVLYGHLSLESLELHQPGDELAAGDVLGWMGAPEVNGGWPPHVHVQLSRVRPERPDLPGAVRPDERPEALIRYPDPRLILGDLY